MANNILVIISSSDVLKARTGIVYATNALKHGWVDDLRLVVFGPAEQVLAQEPVLQEALQTFMEQNQEVAACKAISDMAGVSQGLADLGLQVRYIGELVSRLIGEGYTPLVW
jgi:hypothetical protein